MKLGKKGQGAMEYLMTYGWAILVVMTVGVALWQLGVFGGPPGGVNTASGFVRIKVLEPSIKYSNDGTLEFTLVNGAGQAANEINLEWLKGSCRTSGAQPIVDPEKNITGWPGLSEKGATNGRFAAGKTSHVVITNCEPKGGGESFSVDLKLNYTMTIAGRKVLRKEEGTIKGTVPPI